MFEEEGVLGVLLTKFTQGLVHHEQHVFSHLLGIAWFIVLVNGGGYLSINGGRLVFLFFKEFIDEFDVHVQTHIASVKYRAKLSEGLLAVQTQIVFHAHVLAYVRLLPYYLFFLCVFFLFSSSLSSLLIPLSLSLSLIQPVVLEPSAHHDENNLT